MWRSMGAVDERELHDDGHLTVALEQLVERLEFDKLPRCRCHRPPRLIVTSFGRRLCWDCRGLVDA